MLPAITFYEPEDENGWLCSLSPHPITVDGVTWPTAEHWYQSQKFVQQDIQQVIRTTLCPREAKAVAKANKPCARADWDTVKVEIFYQANAMKFTQHPALRAQLLATGDAEIIEQTDNDAFWGRSANGTGQNMVGVTLMRVRKVLGAD